MFTRRKTLAWPARALAAVAISAVALLSGCGGGGSDDAVTSAPTPDATITAAPAQSGATPFIRLLSLGGSRLVDATRVEYTIAPAAGATAKPVDVTYTMSALARGGYFVAGSSTATVPVFGLYAGRVNHAEVRIGFADGTEQSIPVEIETPAWQDPNGVYDHVNILRPRAAGSALGFDYFFMKSIVDGPVIVDTDGAVRWVSPRAMHAGASIFNGDGFLVGEQTSMDLLTIGLDGKINTTVVNAPTYTNFHHNIDPGKVEFLGEFDATIGGVQNIEATLAEFDTGGNILGRWDFAQILSRYMLSQGDDPTLFVRPGVDWFHMNSAVYDPRDDSLIVSSRENFLVKIDYQTGDIKWVLGDPTKYWYLFPSLRAKALQLAPGGLYPIGQHAVSITPSGLVMVFNDGEGSYNQPPGEPAGETRTYSAVSAYAIDPVAMTAQEVWRFDYDKSIFSNICSSAYQTPDGSVLISYATADGGTKARLVALDAAGNVSFDFAYANPSTCGASWNAEPIALNALVIR